MMCFWTPIVTGAWTLYKGMKIRNLKLIWKCIRGKEVDGWGKDLVPSRRSEPSPPACWYTKSVDFGEQHKKIMIWNILYWRNKWVFFWSRVAQPAPLCIFSKDVHGLNSLPIISIKYMYTRNISSVFVWDRERERLTSKTPMEKEMITMRNKPRCSHDSLTIFSSGSRFWSYKADHWWCYWIARIMYLYVYIQ